MKKFFLYFGFNRLEQRGFFVFTTFMLLIIFIPYGVKLFNHSTSLSPALIYFESQDKEQEISQLDLSPPNKNYASTNTTKDKITYFNFDPNNLEELSWSKLGFSDKQIKVIKNYEAKGGKFFKKEDVAKIYVISSNDYARIAPYIQIKEQKQSTYMPFNRMETKRRNPDVTVLKRTILVNINTADTTEWKELKGIGSVLAKRIVKYRDALGGFYSVDQVKEVYGLPVETFDTIHDKLQLGNDLLISNINVNTVTADELSKHPYISKKQALTIINYRNQHGSFKKVESLSSIHSLDNDFLRKIEPYLEY